MVIQAKRLGHVTLSTPDLPRQLDYYSRIVGLSVIDRTATRAVLASKSGLEAVVLEHGVSARCMRIALQTSPTLDLNDIGAKLTRAGIKFDSRTDLTPGVPRALVFEDPKGTQIEIFNAYSFAPDED